MYHIFFGSRAIKDLRKLDRSMSSRIVAKIETLSEGLSGDVKKLTQHNPQYRLRVGGFRVLFDIDESTILIQRVLNRKDAY